MLARVLSMLALSAVGAAGARGDEAAGTGEFRWRHDLEPARREALTSGKPLLVVFR